MRWVVLPDPVPPARVPRFCAFVLARCPRIGFLVAILVSPVGWTPIVTSDHGLRKYSGMRPIVA